MAAQMTWQDLRTKYYLQQSTDCKLRKIQFIAKQPDHHYAKLR